MEICKYHKRCNKFDYGSQLCTTSMCVTCSAYLLFKSTYVEYIDFF